MTTYPISKIRSGEVAVKLTSIEQFKKIVPEYKDFDEFRSYFRVDYYHGYINDEFQWLTPLEKDSSILIDFQQIDWEEGKEVKEDQNYLDEYLNSLDEIKSLKAENERLKEDKKKLQKEVNDYKLSINLFGLGNNSTPSPNQELSLKQRMAWEYILRACIPLATWDLVFENIDNFLNYKGGDDEQ